ncbi:MAG: Hpt domain-containing protein [Clostridiales bacterium]|nr:Hpt domain-containing protein [Clostridiales bacterium]
MITIDELKQFGANTDEGVARCMGNEEFYLKLVSTVPGQKEFTVLSDKIAEGDLSAAFEAAHALKGVLGNLSLTPLYDKVCEITELLRAKTDTDYSELLKQISDLNEELKLACGK